MKIYTAGVAPCGGGQADYYQKAIKQWRPYILESFYYTDKTTEELIPYMGSFLLDSGAFTFLSNSNVRPDWDKYLTRYADFINRNNVKTFFELDIDSVVGYKQVLEYRKKLEDLTERKCIPVWHRSRGYDDYLKTCEEYDYVAIGGVVIKEISSKEYKIFPRMIDDAHKRNCRVHGLGFTALSWLPRCHFDSVDSTAWTTGNRFGFIYQFTGNTMRKIDVPKDKRLADARQVAMHNYTEWIKFQRWAEEHL